MHASLVSLCASWGATGPELAYTLVFYEMCKSLDIEFMAARFWCGMWCAFMTIVLALSAQMSRVRKEQSARMRRVRRSFRDDSLFGVQWHRVCILRWSASVHHGAPRDMS